MIPSISPLVLHVNFLPTAPDLPKSMLMRSRSFTGASFSSPAQNCRKGLTLALLTGLIFANQDQFYLSVLVLSKYLARVLLHISYPKRRLLQFPLYLPIVEPSSLSILFAQVDARSARTRLSIEPKQSLSQNGIFGRAVNRKEI